MKYNSPISESIHSIASALNMAGAVSNAEMKEYDRFCLAPVEPLDGEAIRQIREKEALTQAAFAIHLNVSKNHVSAWERGVKKPSGAALKLLTIVKNKGIEAIM
ncbi:MAG: DNA-binding transcriptional regulator [Neisseria sp.]|nr:DNA-binding transcriptional regulator [Neisseria sp.]